MSTLRELVKFRSDLIRRSKELTLEDACNGIIRELTLTMTENDQLENFSAHDKIKQTIQHYQHLSDESLLIRDQIMDIVDDVNLRIDEISRQLNQSKRYNVEQISKNPKFARISAINPIVHQLIKDRMSYHSDWKFPGLRLGCGYVGQIELGDYIRDRSLTEEYSNQLVANDPLYFYDTNVDSINDATQHFVDTYQRRIRKYSEKLTDLPQGQFSFIFSWMFFNYIDFNEAEAYLRKIFDLLRPGGVTMFSYNNGDIIDSTAIYDSGEMSHIPKRKLLLLLEQLGFEIIAEYDMPNSDILIKMISWIEIKKPGELKTIRIAPTLGKIGQK